MRYRVSWRKNGKTHHLPARETTPGEALSFAYTLLVEARPSDIWIETPEGRLVATYADIIEEGPMFSASQNLSSLRGEPSSPSSATSHSG